jgi:hypothetical protein
MCRSRSWLHCADHQLAPMCRSVTVREHVIKPSASWTFTTLGELLKAEIRRQIGLSE